MTRRTGMRGDYPQAVESLEPLEPTPAEPVRRRSAALDLEWIEGQRVNLSAAERRVATLLRRRSLKREWQAAWLLKAVTCLDLTSLSGDDTRGRIKRLCEKARRPVRPEILAALGAEALEVEVAAVCVYPSAVPWAAEALAGSDIAVASVATGFPHGKLPLDLRLREIEAAVAAGASEIDIVIDRALVLTGDWHCLHEEIAACKTACGAAHLKVILGTGELGPLRNVARASAVAMLAGADFIKTSTGKEAVNATLPVALTMARLIRDYRERSGRKVGFKPAGGIGTAKDALAYQILMLEELGPDWLEPTFFRLGASSLLADIERQLEHFATGHYAALWRQPLT